MKQLLNALSFHLDSSKTIKVKILKKDLLEANYVDNHDCSLARALKREFGLLDEDICVNPGYIKMSDISYGIDNNDDNKLTQMSKTEYICASLKPKTFILTLNK